VETVADKSKTIVYKRREQDNGGRLEIGGNWVALHSVKRKKHWGGREKERVPVSKLEIDKKKGTLRVKKVKKDAKAEKRRKGGGKDAGAGASGEDLWGGENVGNNCRGKHGFQPSRPRKSEEVEKKKKVGITVLFSQGVLMGLCGKAKGGGK